MSGIGPARFAEHGLHFGIRLQAIRLLQQFSGFVCRDARQRRRRV
jgi:hypothetical protein